MKKAYFWLFVYIAVILSGCSSKGEPKLEKQRTDATQKQKGNMSISVNNFSDCPSYAPSEYKTIPYE